MIRTCEGNIIIAKEKNKTENKIVKNRNSSKERRTENIKKAIPTKEVEEKKKGYY